MLAARPTVAPQARRRLNGTARCSSATRPAWAGDDALSSFVNALIASPLYSLMKPLARYTLIDTAERNGIPWRAEVERQEAERARLEALRLALTDPSVSYPAYYTLPFHAYEEGNLNWLAAEECESATYSMACRVWPQEVKAGALGWEAAQRRLRDSFTDALRAFMARHGCAEPRRILDVGCSVGLSTRALGAAFPTAASVEGLDLSAYMLAAAAARDAQPTAMQPAPPPGQKRSWRHGLAEATGLADASLCVYSAAFVHHELPQSASRAVLAEAHRVLRPSGVYVMTDNNPSSPVIRGLPPALFTLMKSTEPHTDEYYTFDFEAALREAGFRDVQTVCTDPRHRTVLALR